MTSRPVCGRAGEGGRQARGASLHSPRLGARLRARQYAARPSRVAPCSSACRWAGADALRTRSPSRLRLALPPSLPPSPSSPFASSPSLFATSSLSHGSPLSRFRRPLPSQPRRAMLCPTPSLVLERVRESRGGERDVPFRGSVHSWEHSVTAERALQASLSRARAALATLWSGLRRTSSGLARPHRCSPPTPLAPPSGTATSSHASRHRQATLERDRRAPAGQEGQEAAAHLRRRRSTQQHHPAARQVPRKQCVPFPSLYGRCAERQS